jgi:hypothetical protein
MPSDGENLLQQPVPWIVGGATYQLGHTTLELELMLQSTHQASVRNQIEATAGKISPASYQQDVESFNEMRAGNRFAFGTRLSAQWVASAEGFLEYVFLKLTKGEREVKGTPRLSKEKLVGLRKSHPADWSKMEKEVLERDLPFWFAPAPKTSTTESSSSSPENPGSKAEPKS